MSDDAIDRKIAWHERHRVVCPRYGYRHGDACRMPPSGGPCLDCGLPRAYAHPDCVDDAFQVDAVWIGGTAMRVSPDPEVARGVVVIENRFERVGYSIPASPLTPEGTISDPDRTLRRERVSRRLAAGPVGGAARQGSALLPPPSPPDPHGIRFRSLMREDRGASLSVACACGWVPSGTGDAEDELAHHIAAVQIGASPLSGATTRGSEMVALIQGWQTIVGGDSSEVRSGDAGDLLRRSEVYAEQQVREMRATGFSATPRRLCEAIARGYRDGATTQTAWTCARPPTAAEHEASRQVTVAWRSPGAPRARWILTEASGRALQAGPFAAPFSRVRIAVHPLCGAGDARVYGVFVGRCDRDGHLSRVDARSAFAALVEAAGGPAQVRETNDPPRERAGGIRLSCYLPAARLTGADPNDSLSRVTGGVWFDLGWIAPAGSAVALVVEGDPACPFYATVEVASADEA